VYRSNWGRSPNQEVVLAVRLRRAFFDSLLAQAVPSSFQAAASSDRRGWEAAVQRSDVRLQWDPDHAPSGERCARRAIQLGLRRSALIAYSKSELVEIIDMSEFVPAHPDRRLAFRVVSARAIRCVMARPASCSTSGGRRPDPIHARRLTSAARGRRIRPA
jgi:uncharacterized protein DUF4291